MHAEQVHKLRGEIQKLRRRKANVRHRELASLAGQIGRVPVNRGKEPTYEKSSRPPLTIPNHARQMSPYTVAKILDVLEEDLDVEEGEPE